MSLAQEYETVFILRSHSMPTGSSKMCGVVLDEVLQLKQYEIPLVRCMLADPARAPVEEIDTDFLVNHNDSSR